MASQHSGNYRAEQDMDTDTMEDKEMDMVEEG